MADRDPLDTLLAQPDRPVAPSPDFARRLRQRLLAELTPGTRSEGDQTVMPQTYSMPNRRVALDPPAPRRVTWLHGLEIATAVLLVVGAVAIYSEIIRQQPKNNVAAPFFASPATGMSSAATPNVADQPNTTAAPASGPAAMWGGDAARSGTQPGPGPDGEVALRWTDAPGQPMGRGESMVALGNRVYRVVMDADQTYYHVEALDSATGDHLWQAGQLLIFGGLAVTETHVFTLVIEIGEQDDGLTPMFLVAMDAATGVEEWRAELGDPVGGMGASPIVVGDTVYIADPDGTAHAFDTASGDERWTSTAATSDDPRTEARSPDEGEYQGASGSIAVGDGHLYVVNASGEVVALDITSGDERWRLNVGDRYQIRPGVIQPIAADGALLLYVTGNDPAERTTEQQWFNVVGVVESDTGEGLWSREFAGSIGSLIVTSDLVIVPVQGTEPEKGLSPSLIALGLTSGEKSWNVSNLGTEYLWVSATTDSLYLASQDGIVREVDPTNGKERWSFTFTDSTAATPTSERSGFVGQANAPPAVAGGNVYIHDTTGTLTALSAADAIPEVNGTPTP